ncbi:BON domain-containing protein [Acidicapsa acidisoli]|uniref:BON domain-containing protein n=1 Tax=Acidicapsa acidisoli TaxID=1615681 RepID=UPI0021E0D9C1|nr:BON domain-containing protein [Acidicapsa acidisoli]
MLDLSHKYRTSALAISLLAGASFAYAMPAIQQDPANPQSTPAPDNSAQNKGQTDTAEKQGSSPEDREIARKIRRSIMDDNTLSTYAKNVKIIVRDGAVTLKGPVTTEDEKKKIGDLAAQAVSGADKVTNELTIKPS